MPSEIEITETLLRRGWVPPTDPGERSDVVESIKNHLLSPEFCGVTQNLEIGEIGQRFCHWPENTITWHIRDVLPSLGDQTMRAACEAALADIASFFDLSFPYVDSPAQANILVTVAPLGGRGGVLADCQLVPCNIGPKNSVQMLMRADREENWIFENTPAGLNIDWQRVFAHEFTHGLGLPHITTPGSLMLPTYSTTIRGLQPGDIAALEQLGYKRRKATPPPPPPPPPPEPPTGEPPLGRVGYRAYRAGTTVTFKKRAWALEEF